MHDQLPSVDEYKASHGFSSARSYAKFSLKVILCASCTIIVASVLIAVGVVIGRDEVIQEETNAANSDNYNNDYEADLPPPENPVDRMQALTELVENHGWATSIQLETAGTPEYQALDWLANQDPLMLDPRVLTDELANRYILSLFYYSLGGPMWTEQLNFLTEKPVCKWNDQFTTKVGIPITVGVSCHGRDQVREIFLPNNNLKGELPQAIGFLTDLLDLNLFDNHVSGLLPVGMRNCRNLETLVLHTNELRGGIPDWLSESFTNLKTLNLNHNLFSGWFPEGFGAEMSKLETLALEHNQLSGPLDELEGMSSLRALYLGDNRLSGELSDELLLSWSALEVLDVSDNVLEGHLPQTLLAKDGLTVVDLNGNNFSGPLPSLVELGDSIQFLALHENKLTGPIDERLLSLTKLQHLDLSNNDFTGDFPTLLSQLTDLKYLFLAFNTGFKIGTIPTEFGRLTNLVDLSLQKTDRIGHIPTELANLSKLTLLDLNSNLLDGSIPYEFSALTNLKFLLLKDNTLTGEIPPQFSLLTELDTLLLDDNNMEGGDTTICEHIETLTTFIVDCNASGECKCCTKCCADQDSTCNAITWFSGLDPVGSDNYARDSYLFHEDDIMYPVHDSPSDSVPDFYVNFTEYDIEEDPTLFDTGHYGPTDSGTDGGEEAGVNLDFGEDFVIPPEDIPGFQSDEDPVYGGIPQEDIENGIVFDAEDFDPNAGGGRN